MARSRILAGLAAVFLLLCVGAAAALAGKLLLELAL